MVEWWKVMAVVIVSQRLCELYIAKQNRIRVIAEGAQEFGRDHYSLFFLLHIGWLIGWITEYNLSSGEVSELWYIWFSLFVIAQSLRYWCMVSLGQMWNTRILVIPGKILIHKGPYRFLSHPNYIAVAIELVSIPLIFGATITAMAATALNIILTLGIRIPAENRALQLGKADHATVTGELK